MELWTKRIMSQIYDEAKESEELSDGSCLIEEVIVCKEIYNLLKLENFNFKFNPYQYSKYTGDKNIDYNIAVLCEDEDDIIEGLYECRYI